MQLLDQFIIEHATGTRRVELHHGDLTRIPPEEAVDVLVVSAYPNDYVPTSGSLIGALHGAGLSVADLAQRKAVDLRHAFSCWLSEDLGDDAARFGFRRILCFEPSVRGAPEAVVGEIFQSLMPFAHGDPPIRSLAMPLVASGDQRVPVEEMFTPLLEAAVHWLALGLPIDRLKIVEHDGAKAMDLAERFAAFKATHPAVHVPERDRFAYDLFVSYSHENSDAVDFLVAELQRRKPDVRIFLDRQQLEPGHSWQQKILDSLVACRSVVAVYSPAYLQSKMCKEEFGIAWHMNVEADGGVLLPVYLSSADLPAYMKLLQYFDCREDDRARLMGACDSIVRHLEARD